MRKSALGPILAVWAGVLPVAGLAVTVDADAHRDAGVVAAGKALYEAHCAACHGAELEGEPDWQIRDPDGYLPAPPHDATGHTWHHPTLQLFEITKFGTEAMVGGGYRSNMAGFADALSDDEILEILAFIKSTWPRRLTDYHDRLDTAYGNR